VRTLPLPRTLARVRRWVPVSGRAPIVGWLLRFFLSTVLANAAWARCSGVGIGGSARSRARISLSRYRLSPFGRRKDRIRGGSKSVSQRIRVLGLHPRNSAAAWGPRNRRCGEVAVVAVNFLVRMHDFLSPRMTTCFETGERLRVREGKVWQFIGKVVGKTFKNVRRDCHAEGGTFGLFPRSFFCFFSRHLSFAALSTSAQNDPDVVG
jgi:hypothetical protein